MPVILSQVTYAYQPLVFDDFMKRNYASSGGPYTLGENIYHTPHGPVARAPARRPRSPKPSAVSGA